LLRKVQLSTGFERAAAGPPLQTPLLGSSLVAPPVFDPHGRRSDPVKRLERRAVWITGVGLSVWIACGLVIQLGIPLHRITS
jgi:hypothetical protein